MPMVARRRGRAWGERGNGEMLTVDPAKASAGLGTSCVRRIDGDGDLRRPEVMKATGLGSTLRCTGERAGGGYGLLVLR